MEKQKERMLPSEAAEYLLISYPQLMKLCRLKKIPCWRNGRRYLFTKTTLDSWITEQEQKSVEE